MLNIGLNIPDIPILGIGLRPAGHMLADYTNGVAFDFKRDNYAIKDSGEIIEGGSISGGMSSQFPNGISRNANGFLFDGTFFHAGWPVSDLPSWNHDIFTYYIHIHNSDDTTGSRRIAMTFLSAGNVAQHGYDFVQGGQTNSRMICTVGGTQYNIVSPADIAGVRETIRALVCQINDAQAAEDGVLNLHDNIVVMPQDTTKIVWGNTNGSSATNPLNATIESIVIAAGVRDIDATLITKTILPIVDDSAWATTDKIEWDAGNTVLWS